MRGCLSVLVLAVVLVLVGVWFAGPPVAAGLVQAALTSAGLRADHVDVVVEADPPLELALGHADRITVDGTDVRWNGHPAASLHLVLDHVDLFDRSAAHTAGRLVGVELSGVQPNGSTATIDIAGRGPSADVTITIPRSTAQAMATAALEQKTGLRPSSTILSAPNVLRFTVGRIDASGAITVGPDGSLGVATPQGRVIVLEPGASEPIRLTGVSVEGGDLVLTGTVDLASLIR